MFKKVATITIALLLVMIAVVIFLHPGGKKSGAFYTQSTTGGPSGHMTMAQGTTTICAIQSPPATSTLIMFDAHFDYSSTTASYVTLATSTSAFSTTTPVAQMALAANAQGNLIATTSPVIYGIGSMGLIAPSTWLVAGMSGGAGTFSPSGACNAVFGSLI